MHITLLGHKGWQGMAPAVTDVKKYDMNRRIYLPRWVEEELNLVAGETYVTFVKSGDEVLIKKVAITIAPLDQGMQINSAGVALIAESQLFGQRVMQRRRRGKATDLGDAVIRNLTELREGAPVVHIDHGVGRYRGLTNLTVEDQQAEFWYWSTPTRRRCTCQSPTCT